MSDYEFNAVIGNECVYHKCSEENERPLAFKKKCIEECYDLDFGDNSNVEYYLVDNVLHEESKIHMKNKKTEQEFCEKLLEKLDDCEFDIEELQTSENTSTDDFIILVSAWDCVSAAMQILRRVYL